MKRLRQKEFCPIEAVKFGKLDCDLSFILISLLRQRVHFYVVEVALERDSTLIFSLVCWGLMEKFSAKQWHLQF